MTPLGRDDISDRDIFCLAASSFAELPAHFTLPTKRFVALLVADTTQTDVNTLSRFSETLLASGCVYFCSWGPGCERAHDIMDECSLDIDPVIMTTWHDDESLDEALYFFLRNTWPDEGYSEDGSALRLLLVVPSGLRRSSADYATEIRLLRMYSRKRPNQAMEPTTGRRTLKFSMTSTSHPAATRALASGGSSCSR